MRAKLKSELQAAITFLMSGNWWTPEFIKAVILPTLALGGLVTIEKLASPLLLQDRGLAFLYFIPIWLGTKMGSRSSGIVVAAFAAVALQIGAPPESSPFAIIVNFILLSMVTIIFYQVEQGIARNKRQATTDQLTGLLSRRGFMQEAKRALSSTRLNREQAAVILFDCDRFKQINDTHGHAVGDQALRIIAKALRSASHGDDVVARLGGDEFVVFLSGSDSIGANIYLSRARHLVQELSQDFPATLRLSAGIAFSPDEARDLSALLEIADEKMFRQKRARAEYTHSAVTTQETRSKARA